MWGIQLLKELASFIRVETCIFIAGISVSGYMMFTGIGPGLLNVFMAVFLGTGASYAYNCLTDTMEDSVNNSGLNQFAFMRTSGRLVVAALFIGGFTLSLRLSPLSAILYFSLIILSVLYSGTRVKERFLLKNVYTGFSITLTFLIGAFAYRGFSLMILAYSPFIFLFGFTLNLLGDIRGLEGDSSIGMRTIPTVFGVGASKRVVYITSGMFLISVVASGLVLLYPLLPFMILIPFFLHMDDHRKTRASMLSSFVFFPIFLVVIRMFGGV